MNLDEIVDSFSNKSLRGISIDCSKKTNLLEFIHSLNGKLSACHNDSGIFTVYLRNLEDKVLESQILKIRSSIGGKIKFVIEV